MAEIRAAVGVGHVSPDFVTQKTRILQLIDKQHFVSLRHLILGDAKGFLTMFIRKKRHRSGNIGVIVVEKICGKIKELANDWCCI